MGTASSCTGRGDNGAVVSQRGKTRGLCFPFGLEEMRQFLSKEDESKPVKDEEGEQGAASHSENRESLSCRGGVLKWHSSLSSVSLGEREAHSPSTEGIVG